MCHDHSWVEAERFYASPARVELQRASEGLARQSIFGLTTILYRCASCTGTYTVEILGKSLGKLENVAITVDAAGIVRDLRKDAAS